MSLDEFQLIGRYLKNFASRSDVLLGIGDDGAILKVPDGHQLVVSSDTLVEGVHFPKHAQADRIARRTLRVNLSDMAAMAALPRWFTLTLTLPDADEQWMASFSDALKDDAQLFDCVLVGGDTTGGPLNIGIQMMGTVDGLDSALKRSGARPGDLLVVTGTLGDAAGALLCLDHEAQLNPDVVFLQSRYWQPEPRVAFAQQARHLINAACDISDGLLADVGHICEASRVGVEVYAASLPLSDSLRRICGPGARDRALSGGDDYELCMAVSSSNMDALTEIAYQLALPLTVVGEFRAGEGVSCIDENNQLMAVESYGYQHF